MADHYRAAVDLLADAAALREELNQEYRQPRPDSRRVASLHDRIRSTTKTAEVHSNLAVAQCLAEYGLRS